MASRSYEQIANEIQELLGQLRACKYKDKKSKRRKKDLETSAWMLEMKMRSQPKKVGTLNFDYCRSCRVKCGGKNPRCIKAIESKKEEYKKERERQNREKRKAKKEAIGAIEEMKRVISAYNKTVEALNA